MSIKSWWVTWDELLPYKDQLINMELELMVKYHYPDKVIPKSYPESRVNSLREYLQNGSTFLWISTDGEKLLGYYWAYISTFIDKKRWNLRSIMFLDEAKGNGLIQTIRQCRIFRRHWTSSLKNSAIWKISPLKN